jgi:hypothetical protein
MTDVQGRRQGLILVEHGTKIVLERLCDEDGVNSRRRIGTIEICQKQQIRFDVALHEIILARE